MPVTVTIGTDEYDAYVAVEDVDSYANGSLTASAWDSLIPDDKARAIVTATRWIDSVCWKGEKIDPSQPLEWPRTVGNLRNIEQAAIVLAVLVAADPEVADKSMGLVVEAGAGVKRLKAGSVELEYFREMNFQVYKGRVDPFPAGVMRLVSAYTCAKRGGVWGSAGSTAWGTCRDSVTGERGKYRFTEPF